MQLRPPGRSGHLPMQAQGEYPVAMVQYRAGQSPGLDHGRPGDPQREEAAGATGLLPARVKGFPQGFTDKDQEDQGTDQDNKGC